VIVSLNLPEEVVAYIDRKATEGKQSRSAWMTAAVRHMQLMASPAGRKGFAHLLVGVMADGALRSGQPLERVRQVFPDFERPCLLDEAPRTPPTRQLSAAADHTAAPSPPAESVAVKRRRPYQRAGKRGGS
jgi:hypothetical protein